MNDAQDPPAKRFTVESAIAYLHARRGGYESAVETLGEYAHPAALVEIVARFFPEHLAASGIPLARSASGQFRELEAKTGELVHYGLFSLDEPMLDFYDDEGSDEPLAQIPLAHFFNPNDENYGEVISEWTSGLALAAALAHRDPEGYELLTLVGFDEDAIERLSVAPRVDTALLRAHCRRERTPLRYLHTLLRAITGDTGTVYFDNECTCGNCLTIDWSVENVEALVAQDRVVSAIFDQAHELSEWLDADYCARAEAAVRLWNRAAPRRRPDDKSR